MEIRDLILSATNKSWKMSTTHGTEYDRLYKSSKGPGKKKDLFDEVWKRDKYKCYYCNFESKKHQEIHHLNDNHEDYSVDNLVTICPLCHQSFHLDNSNGGKIIWLPEFTQQELNYICRALFIASEDYDQKEKEGKEVIEFTKLARVIEDSLWNRSLIVDQQFQNGASDPATFAGALLNMSSEDYERRYTFLKPFKILPVRARFSVQSRYWKGNTFADLPVETWEKLIIKQNPENN